MAGLSKKIIKKEEREEKEKRGWGGVPQILCIVK